MCREKAFYDDPLVRAFFDDPVNRELYSMKTSNFKAATEFEKRFAEFYLKLRITSYTNKLTRHYSRDYDKKRRMQRYQLQLDQPHDQDSSERFVDSIPATNTDVTDNLINSVADLLPSTEMKHRFTHLSIEKKKILHQFTFNQLNNKEIALKMNCSPQNVSKLKKNALKELKGG